MATVNQYMLHAIAFLKAESTFASSEELRFANSVNDIVTNFYRWHWNEAAATNISLSSSVQDYSMAAGDQNTVLSIANAYLTDAGSTYGELLIYHDRVLPITAVTGRPISVGMISGTQVRVWPSPNATYTLTWRKYKRATVFAANSESWDVPAAFDAVVKAGMIWQILNYQEDARAEGWQKTFYDLMANLRNNERVASGRKR